MVRFRLLTAFALLLLAASANAQSGSGRKKARRNVRMADSLRLATRRAADEGRLLQWGDSLLRARLDSGAISSKRYGRFRKRLAVYDRRFRRGDSLLARRYNRISFDTMYVARPDGRWTIKLRGNISGAKTVAEGNNGGRPYRGEVRADYRGTMSVSVAYRGISLGLAFNPAKLAGRNKDFEFNMNSYGNKFGFDVVYLSSKTYKGKLEYGGVETELAKGLTSQNALNLNAYYAFNGRKFSFPAAFSQSYVQRRSAGSFLLGVSVDGQATKVSPDDQLAIPSIKLKLWEFALGAGYGYNLVAGSHWLFHLSALPTFDVMIHSNLRSEGKKVSMSYRFPSLIMTGRGAVVYSWRRKFAGITMVLNSSTTGRGENLRLERDKWRMRLFYGFRF